LECKVARHQFGGVLRSSVAATSGGSSVGDEVGAVVAPAVMVVGVRKAGLTGAPFDPEYNNDGRIPAAANSTIALPPMKSQAFFEELETVMTYPFR
jgi:hypothetical protein